MDKLTVLVLFGGKSSEHDVSCVSASSVIANIPQDKYDIIKMGITKDGAWYRFNGDTALLPEDKWLEDAANLVPAFVSPDPTLGGIVETVNGEARVTKIDVVFPVLHGKNGEDGTVQGLLQLAEIPYVGCDMTSSAACMDKALTNALADRAGIPQAKWLSYTEHEYRSNPHKALDECVEKLGYPIFVKPAKAGSSVGISKANDLNELADAFETAFANDSKVVLEETVIGSEVECAVLGNDEPVAATPGEIAPCNDFYDFDAKYVSGDSGLFIPARISEDMLKKVQKEAIRAYKALGCSGFSRVDFFVNGEEIKLNEINTIPGFTSISMYPKLWAHSGLAYPELIDKLLCLAIEKRAREI
ncbi:MAG: D-alanine--D-alanine ligase [Clostridia bacterium]|nr:D-alanine--D-alanine ligase [Clostridia bacterium]